MIKQQLRFSMIRLSRNWLEAGEHIRLSSMEVDLNNGLIGLPVGQEDGVLKDKLFAIRSQGQEICKSKNNPF